MSKQVKYNQLLITQDDCEVAARIVYINRTGTELSQEWTRLCPCPHPSNKVVINWLYHR